MNRGSEEQCQQTELDFWKEKYLDLKNAVGDIEVRKRLEEEIRLDPLTRILNKKAFREEVEAFLENAGEQETAWKRQLCICRRFSENGADESVSGRGDRGTEFRSFY